MDDNHRPQLQSTLVQMFSIKPFNGLQLTQLKRKGNQTNQKKEAVMIENDRQRTKFEMAEKQGNDLKFYK